MPQVTDSYFAAPQIEPSDVPDIAAQGYDTIICNRPDAEVTPELGAAQIGEIVEAAGMKFVVNPLAQGGLSMEVIQAQAEAIAASEKCFAYCASGNRSTILWALAMAGKMPRDEIVAAGEAAGYAIRGLTPQIDMLAGNQD